MPQPTKKQERALTETILRSQAEDRVRKLLAEARGYIDRARISHLGVDPIISKHNEKCLDLMKRIDAELA